MNVLKPCRHGLMLFNTNDVYIGRSLNDYGEFSQEEVDIFKELIKPGMTVIDIGANIGAHTLAFAKMVGPTGSVFAFEPQRSIYYTLCANVALNNLTNVYCLQNAVGNKDGRIEIPDLDGRKSQNFGGLQLGVYYPNSKASCSVKLVKLDNMKFERVDFIKIDIEGMEPEAIMGASEIINKHRPILYLESDRKENMSLIVKLIRSLKYDAHFHSPLLFNINNYDGNNNNIFGNTCSINMLCNPEEKPLTLSKDDFRLMPLRSDGKVVLKTSVEHVNKVYDSIHKEVTDSCLKVARYYSDQLYEHNRALAFTEFALRTNPHNVDAYHYAAQIFARLYRYDESLKLLDAALEEEERSAIMFTRAAVLGGLGRYEDAITQYRQAIEIDPKNPDIHFNMACSLIAIGQFEEGWQEYEWRFHLMKVKQFLKVMPDLPMWDGQPLNGQRLLLFAEQGYGDALQFIRYIKYIKDAKISLICHTGLEKLLSNYKGIDNIISFNSDDATILSANDFDYMMSLLSLPKLFNGLEKQFDVIVPDKKDWKSPCHLKKKDFKIGIAWAGNEMHEMDHGRSCYLREFTAIQDIPGVKLYSLQKGDSKRTFISEGRINLKDVAENIKLEDYTDSFNDFNDTANFIQELDLVITVDTAVGHLAASMNKPTWILLGFYPDHRWFVDKENSPWYPSVKLFRHPKGEKNWSKVFQDVKKELTKKLK